MLMVQYRKELAMRKSLLILSALALMLPMSAWAECWTGVYQSTGPINGKTVTLTIHSDTSGFYSVSGGGGYPVVLSPSWNGFTFKTRNAGTSHVTRTPGALQLNWSFDSKAGSASATLVPCS